MNLKLRMDCQRWRVSFTGQRPAKHGKRARTNIYTIHRCPVCWGRKDLDKPVCFIAVGLLQEGLKWVSGGNDFRVYETKCVSMGDEVCEFTIQKMPIS
jgi:predicted hydrocarbon binding protein